MPHCLRFAADSHLVSASNIHLFFIALLNYLRVLKSHRKVLEGSFDDFEFRRLCEKFPSHSDTEDSDFHDRREEFNFLPETLPFHSPTCIAAS